MYFCLSTRVAQLLTARSGLNICYSTKLRESKNINFSFLPFTSDPFLSLEALQLAGLSAPALGPASWRASRLKKWVRSKW